MLDASGVAAVAVVVSVGQKPGSGGQQSPGYDVTWELHCEIVSIPVSSLCGRCRSHSRLSTAGAARGNLAK